MDCRVLARRRGVVTFESWCHAACGGAASTSDGRRSIQETNTAHEMQFNAPGALLHSSLSCRTAACCVLSDCVLRRRGQRVDDDEAAGTTHRIGLGSAAGRSRRSAVSAVLDSQCSERRRTERPLPAQTALSGSVDPVIGVWLRSAHLPLSSSSDCRRRSVAYPSPTHSILVTVLLRLQLQRLHSFKPTTVPVPARSVSVVVV